MALPRFEWRHMGRGPLPAERTLDTFVRVLPTIDHPMAGSKIALPLALSAALLLLEGRPSPIDQAAVRSTKHSAYQYGDLCGGARVSECRRIAASFACEAIR